MPKPPHWLPWLGPLLAAGVGAAVGKYGLGGGFWTVLIAALVCGFAPIVAYGLWKGQHHRKG
jgi:4-hydroxybenzoate polyprenyltransferase